MSLWQALMLPPWRFLASRWPWIALLHDIGSALLALILAPVLLITLVALPLWGVLVGALERRRLRLLGAGPIASGHVRVPSGERRNWLSIRLGEPATWRETASMLSGLVFGALALATLFAEAVVLIAVVGVPLQASVRPVDVRFFADVRMQLGPDLWWPPLLLAPFALILAAYLNAGLAALHGACARWLISPRTAEIDQRVAQLTRSRAAIMTAHETERRRIERDLHDGVQQELVGIAARLGILELELGAGDAEAALAALRGAQGQTERALAVLRETVRGIHPAVLGDHGLAAALDELSGRTAVPLRIEDAGFPRLRPDAEAAAYFFVAEAMTNAAKHTAATRAVVRLETTGSGSRVTVTDNGHGGADPDRGSGLRGLLGRAEALGAEMRITSPAGGPTVLTLLLPRVLENAPEAPGAAR